MPSCASARRRRPRTRGRRREGRSWLLASYPYGSGCCVCRCFRLQACDSCAEPSSAFSTDRVSWPSDVCELWKFFAGTTSAERIAQIVIKSSRRHKEEQCRIVLQCCLGLSCLYSRPSLRSLSLGWGLGGHPGAAGFDSAAHDLWDGPGRADAASNSGTWSNSPSSFEYQWRRCDSVGNACVTIASGSSYRLVAADAGRTLRVRVFARNADGAGSAESAHTAVVAAAQAAPATRRRPRSLGRPGSGRRCEQAAGRGVTARAPLSISGGAVTL